MRQRTKELEDKHKAALDALAADSAIQLKKLADDLVAASTAKTDLDKQVAKLTEELAGSAKEVATLKDEARKGEVLLKTCNRSSPPRAKALRLPMTSSNI